MAEKKVDGRAELKVDLWAGVMVEPTVVKLVAWMVDH
jgi:hypothetical protein